MFDHVLVPLDSSMLSEKALRYAQQVICQSGHITLLMVLEVIDPAVFAGDVHFDMASVHTALEASQQDRRKRAKAYLHQVADRLATPNLKVEKQVQIGHPPDVIVDTAQRLGVGAIVMSTHGRTGLSRWLYGSVTQKVLDAAPCPVFVIPSRIALRHAQG